MMAETKKKTETAEAPLTMEQVRAEVAKLLAEARQEADRIIAEAKQSAGKPGTGRMSPEELKAYTEYMNEYVEVELFRDNGKYKDDVFVAVNGENCVIKRGERVKIKRKFAEVLEQSARQRKEAARFSESKSAEWEKKSKAIQ